MTVTPSTRPSLIIRLRDPRDHEAWIEFVTLYEPVIYRLLRRSGLQDADGREVCQDVFLAVSRNVERWEVAPERGSFRGWLNKVTRNLVVSLIRHRRHRPTAHGGTDLDCLFASLPDATGPESVDFDEELSRSCFRHAAAIVQTEVSAKAWQAFWQTAVEGLAPAEVARELEMSAGAIRVAKCRVLARLKTVVSEQETAWPPSSFNSVTDLVPATGEKS